MVDVIIYEEDVLTRTLLQEWLREAGYVPRAGTTCNAGRDTPADLVVVNVSNPKQRGTQCIGSIRAAHPGRPVIAISAQFPPGVAADGAAARALDVQRVVAKPLVRDELLKAVRAVTVPLP